jgi:type IV pilus assembly protein PilW
MSLREKKTLQAGPDRKNSGFSLVELLVAMVLGIIVLGATYSLFLVQQRIFTVQEDYLELQQSLRAAVELMTREISMAGYNPTGNAAAGIVTAGTTSLVFTMDITNDSGTGPPDGDTNDANENITYSLYTADGVTRLGRRSSAGAAFQPLADNITVLTFAYETGNRVITVTVTGRTARPDPSYQLNNGYRTLTLTGVAMPRNLGL